jgi:hypothetical protein
LVVASDADLEMEFETTYQYQLQRTQSSLLEVRPFFEDQSSIILISQENEELQLEPEDEFI